MKPEPQAKTPIRQAARQHGLLRAQLMPQGAHIGDDVTFNATSNTLPDMVAIGATSNFVTGGSKMGSQTYSAASFLKK